jgi:hypothetical protein
MSDWNALVELHEEFSDVNLGRAVAASAPVADMGETSEWEPPPFAGHVVVTDVGPELEPWLEETQVMEKASVTPITRAHEIRAEAEVPGWRREYDAITGRRHRPPRDFFPRPETTEWSLNELQFNALRD